jgi:hypothetical protein
MTIGERLLILFVLVGVPLTFVGAAIFVLRGGITRFALKPLQRCYDGLRIHETPQPSDVFFAYHTYRRIRWSRRQSVICALFGTS